MILHAGIRHRLSICHVRVIPVDENPGLRDILGQIISRPERTILMCPSLEGMVDSAAGIESVDEYKTIWPLLTEEFGTTRWESLHTRFSAAPQECILLPGTEIRTLMNPFSFS
jgi:hypothetical protein